MITAEKVLELIPKEADYAELLIGGAGGYFPGLAILELVKQDVHLTQLKYERTRFPLEAGWICPQKVLAAVATALNQKSIGRTYVKLQDSEKSDWEELDGAVDRNKQYLYNLLPQQKELFWSIFLSCVMGGSMTLAKIMIEKVSVMLSFLNATLNSFVIEEDGRLELEFARNGMKKQRVIRTPNGEWQCSCKIAMRRGEFTHLTMRQSCHHILTGRILYDHQQQDPTFLRRSTLTQVVDDNNTQSTRFVGREAHIGGLML
jgi:hypothetical protein